MTTADGDDLELLLDRLSTLAAASVGDRRRVLGVAGPPGAGKTTLVLRVLAAAAGDGRLAGRVAHVPMDGFHLPGPELRRLGRETRKGAPDTFDTSAYAATLQAARDLPRRRLLAPSFDHAVGEPEPEAIEVPAESDLVVTEGNYLLLDDPAWLPVRRQLDEVWFCALADDVRRGRLVARHVDAGRPARDAAAWVARSDEANARLVASTAGAAHLVLVDGRVV
ncbi:nucleoside/nucleotide kinase family protein [Pedococcus sp. 5OH_020]|uniref:nucleoside/nucleotide kinase family protein n=1 Tax=Pedococcus sp. 5OH_020 TaxID=2989814 RepID=UPI0022E9A291|nr:nucleoside/nucleotide kinase family protein [Pedococcus sp. 5OH_020]